MRSSLIALSLVALLAFPLQAQVTIQTGSTLAQMINNLYGGDGIQLKPNGHEAHFGESEDFQQFTDTLQKTLQARPIYPIPSSVGVVSFQFNEETGTYERVQSSFGPILSERATTSGRGHVNFSTSLTVSDFETFNGGNTIPLTLHHCLLPQCTFGDPNAPFLHDVIRVEVHLKLRSQVLATSVVYGLTDRVDLGVVVPYIRNDLNVFTHAFVIVAPGSNPATHQFDPSIETPDQMATGHAIGIGDIVLRGKVRLPSKRFPFDTALLTDVTVPTGQKENFLGTGDTRVKETLILSKTGPRFAPHINLGYEWNTTTSKLSGFDWRGGTEVLLTPRLSAAADILGTVKSRAANGFTVRALENESLVGRSLIDGSIGGKWQINPHSLFTLNLVAPMNNVGIRPNTTITFGVQVGM